MTLFYHPFIHPYPYVQFLCDSDHDASLPSYFFILSWWTASGLKGEMEYQTPFMEYHLKLQNSGAKLSFHISKNFSWFPQKESHILSAETIAIKNSRHYFFTYIPDTFKHDEISDRGSPGGCMLLFFRYTSSWECLGWFRTPVIDEDWAVSCRSKGAYPVFARVH